MVEKNLVHHYLKEILLLKSAFHVIDQMFRQEIKNAETIKKSCWLTYLYKIIYVSNNGSLIVTFIENGAFLRYVSKYLSITFVVLIDQPLV